MGPCVRFLHITCSWSILGHLSCFFCWFGFNCGSTLAASTDIAGIGLNTVIAACFGGLASGALSWLWGENHRVEPELVTNGLLGGLVDITAGCASVETWGAALIGLGAGGVMYYARLLIERKLKLNDVVGAVAVRGVCGLRRDEGPEYVSIHARLAR